MYEHNSHSISQELTVFVPAAGQDFDPVKICRLRLTNNSSRKRNLSATYFATLVLGTHREQQKLHVQTAWDAESSSVLARSFWSGAEAGASAFLTSIPEPASHSGDRSQFLGRNGSMASPAALAHAKLDDRTGAELDAAAAVQVKVSIDPGSEIEVVFLLGQVATTADVRALVHRYRLAGQVQAAFDNTRLLWDKQLTAVQVQTPVLAVNFMLNGWLLYQTLACRVWARSAFYQSGGAFGFRDQLQDCLALLYSRPELARAQILLSASRQFREGDVQHWWHPDSGVGVRTRCSDDLVWLAYAASQYVTVTGDATILDEEVAFLEGAVLEASEQERVFVPPVSTATAPLWKHCAMAVDHAARLGSHGLPLIGSGDWNDGMSDVGKAGRGESTWLAWFLGTVHQMFIPYLETRDPAHAAVLRQRSVNLASAMENSAWDGEWYLRGFFDNGTPLGSHANSEAQIDSLPQSWAVISGMADPDRAHRALASAQRLVLEKEKLVLLFTPPFDHSEPHPGYIMGYPPGVRENGGQYTHGSLWLAMAWARARQGNNAVKLLQLMNPVEHSRSSEDAMVYGGEPYVVAADISSAPGRMGRSGWTWYTGSAGWMYRVWIEEVLGLHVHGDQLSIDPVIPDAWPGFEMKYRYKSTTYEIRVGRIPEGVPPDAQPVRMVDDGRVHRVTVLLPRPMPEHVKAAIKPSEGVLVQNVLTNS